MSENLENRITSTQAKDAIYKAHSISSSASEIDATITKVNTRVWIDYTTIKTVQELANGIIKYTDSQGSYYRKIIDSPYEDIIYADENLTIELTRRT